MLKNQTTDLAVLKSWFELLSSPSVMRDRKLNIELGFEQYKKGVYSAKQSAFDAGYLDETTLKMCRHLDHELEAIKSGKIEERKQNVFTQLGDEVLEAALADKINSSALQHPPIQSSFLGREGLGREGLNLIEELRNKGCFL